MRQLVFNICRSFIEQRFHAYYRTNESFIAVNKFFLSVIKIIQGYFDEIILSYNSNIFIMEFANETYKFMRIILYFFDSFIRKRNTNGSG